MVVYSIKDLEKLSGVKAHTLRIWEKRYNIIQPQRTPTNIRYYLDEDLKVILNIALLNRNGIKISKIAKMDNGEIQRKVAEITEVDESFEGQLDSLTISLIELDEGKFIKLINKNVEQRGFAATMLEVIYPLLDKLAMMWIAGSIKSIHERFVSYVIKRKCSVEIDKLPITKSEDFLIFLPEGESNELSLLFLHYLIRLNGFRVINAGPNIELYDLLEVVEIRKPSYIYTIVNDTMTPSQFEIYAERLCTEFEDATIILSGIRALTYSPPEELKNRIRVIESSEETMTFLESV